jgi:hypothetical protein
VWDVSDAKIRLGIYCTMTITLTIGLLVLAFWFDWRIGAALVLWDLRITTQKLAGKEYAKVKLVRQ